MTMKRTLSLILAILLTLSMLAGCGGKTPETTAPVNTPETAEPVETTAPAAPETTAPAVPETTEPTIPETTEPVLEERALTLGVVEGNTYTNAYAGFGCTLDAGWTILPADQIQELPALVKDAVDGTAVGEAMQDVQQFTDMMAENAEQLTNMNILFQKLGVDERLMYKLLDEEAVVDATLSQKDAMIEAYTAMGLNVSSIEKVTVTFLGEEHFAMKTVAEIQGLTCYMLQMFRHDLGEYMVTMTLTSYLEDNTDSMLDLFFAVE